MTTEPPYTPVNEPKIEYIPFDGLKFKTVFYQHPEDTEYKGRIVYVHGFAESSTIYVEYFDKLSRQGYDIFFFDQRGAGETSPESDHGKTNEEHVCKDTDFFVHYNLQQLKGANEKLILMGHLMGGGIILNYGIKGKYKDNIRAIVACAPEVVLHPNTAPNFVLKSASNLLYKLSPDFRLDAGLNYDYITSNQKWIDYIKANTKKFMMSASLFHDMVFRGELLTKPEYASKFTPDIKLLIIHGTNDNVNWIEGSKKFFGLLNDNVDKEFYSVKDGRHSLFIENDDIFNEVFNKVLKFLN